MSRANVVAAVFAALLAALLLIASRSGRSNERVVGEILDGGWTTNDQTEAVRDALRVVTRGTSFASRWSINAPPARDRLNVYILRSGLQRDARTLPARFGNLLNNCAFAGPPNVIICDAQFITGFAAEHGVRCSGRDERARSACDQQHRRALLTWVLGHELGHVVHGDPPAHFGQSRLDEMVPSNSIAQERESRADGFLIERLRGDDRELSDVVSFLIDLLNSEIAKKVKKVPYGVGILYDYRHKEDLAYATLGDHPEFVVRCVRMLDAARLGDGLEYELHDLAAHMRAAGVADSPWTAVVRRLLHVVSPRAGRQGS